MTIVVRGAINKTNDREVCFGGLLQLKYIGIGLLKFGMTGTGYVLFVHKNVATVELECWSVFVVAT